MITSNWKIEIYSSHESPLNRQVTEAVRISRAAPDIHLNSKNEFGANNLAEIELRYGTRIGGGGLKRKRRDEDEEDNNNGGEEVEGSTQEEDFSVLQGGPLFRGDENPRGRKFRGDENTQGSSRTNNTNPSRTTNSYY